jgi:hypothetical protein
MVGAMAMVAGQQWWALWPAAAAAAAATGMTTLIRCLTVVLRLSMK